MKQIELWRDLVTERKFALLKQQLLSLPSPDLAEELSDAPEQYALLFFRLLPKENAAEVFSYLTKERRHALIQAFSDKELRILTEELFLDDCADLVEEMPATVVTRILAAADPETRRQLNELLRYPDDSAGGIMTTEFVMLRCEMTVAEAFEKIRREAIDKETVYTAYIVDRARRLIGTVSAKELLLASPDKTVGEIYRPNALSVSTGDDRESVARMFDKYDLLALPVVDAEERLVGIVTVDDAIDVLHAEAEEDFQVMAAMTPTDTPYLRTSPLRLYLARIPWLCILLLSATLTGAIISSFEAALAVSTVLAAFIPMLMGTGGNAGSQASVVVIRGLSLGEIEPRDVFRVLWKELRVAVLTSLTLAVLAFVKVILVDGFLFGSIETHLYETAFVVAAALLLTVIAALLIGGLLPVLAKALRLDPAVMASPFITTIVDAVALLVYFYIASAALLPLL